MLATGGVLACAALLALALVAPVFRGSNPPRWTTYGWAGEIVTLAIVCTLAIGIGYLGAGTIRAAQAGLDYADLALLAGVLLISCMIWRWLRARRSSAGRPAAPVAAPPVALVAAGEPGAGATGADPGVPLTPSPSKPPRSTRRAA